MLNTNKSNLLTSFSADIFMSEEHNTASGLRFWTLRLLVQGKLIDAFHWNHAVHATVKYNERDSILVAGNWTTEQKKRFQITRSTVITSSSANEDKFNPNTPYQFEFNFCEDIKLIGKG